MILSWNVKSEIHQETCSLTTLSLPILCELYSELRMNAKNMPIVIESNHWKEHPKELLELLSNRLGNIKF